MPGIYTKLIEIDKVDLLIGPYATNMVAPVIPVLMQKGKMTVGILANAANHEFHYPRYFSMNATGPDPERSYSTGFLAVTQAQTPKPQTIALVGADAEYGRNAIEGTRKNAVEAGLKIVYDRYYPPTTTDCAPIMRAVQATNPDIVFVAAYPPDTVCIVRAAAEVGLDTKVFGGALVGLSITSVKQQLGPLMNGIINNVVFAPAKTLMSPEAEALIAAYQARAAQGERRRSPGLCLSALRLCRGPGAGGGGHGDAEPRCRDSSPHISTRTRSRPFCAIWPSGRTANGPKSGRLFTQFRHVAPDDIDQFRSTEHEAILWPPTSTRRAISSIPTTAQRNNTRRRHHELIVRISRRSRSRRSWQCRRSRPTPSRSAAACPKPAASRSTASR